VPAANMVTVVNSKADVLKASQALAVNLNAAKGLQEVMKSNLGPRGTLKMLVGGAGQIKITKDGSVLLGEMQIQHPTASMIARAASAQDEFTGDGTTSSVMFIGELMKLAEQSLAEGLHPRLIAEGFELAREETVKFLDSFKVHMDEPLSDREKLVCVARTSLRTKIVPALADPMAEVVVDSVRMIKKQGSPLDLNMVEILHMKNKLITETRLIKGLVLDHGARHPDMPKKLENCYILTCNVSLEYEKSEVNAGFFYSSSEQREKLVDSERKFTDEKVKKIIELKRKVCTEENGRTFVVINQKGIDPPSLEMLAREATAPAMTRTSPKRSVAALAILAAALWSLAPGQSYTAPAGGGLNRKQMHGNIRNKDKLGGVVEIPVEEEEEEVEAKPEMPEKRVPYSMHIVTQLPQHKHLHEESNARKFIEDKLVGAFENFEDLIRHVEVHLQVSPHFHREKRPDKVPKTTMTVDEEGDEVPMEVQQEAGHKMLTPFIVKATLTLANHHKVALTNPEKHAQPSLTEAVDHMTDVLRHSLREEKNRMISSKRKAQENALADDMDGMLDDDYNLAIANDMAESSPEENARMEALYERIEAAS
ncbi:CCT6A, partial [Symbiodinium sp. CCMP2456]